METNIKTPKITVNRNICKIVFLFILQQTSPVRQFYCTPKKIPEKRLKLFMYARKYRKFHAEQKSAMLLDLKDSPSLQPVNHKKIMFEYAYGQFSV